MAGREPKHNKLRAIGKALMDEEARFIGYSEIERKSKELGFGMSVRTIRFYVDEGILPPPKKVGKTPVYEEEWILNTLLSIHLMKTRLNRSLTEIRTILGRMESPEALSDKLSVLYEDYVKGGFLKPMEKAGLVDGFFDLLIGRLGQPFQATDIKMAELVDAIATHGKWIGEEWDPPPREAILESQGSSAIADGLSIKVVEVQRRDGSNLHGMAPGMEGKGDEPNEQKKAKQAPPKAKPVNEEREAEPPPAPPAEPAPEDAITARRARALEQTYVQRFKANFETMGRVHCPLDTKAYKAGPRERTFVKRDQSSDVIDLMKRHRIYDRSVRDQLPMSEAWEYQVYQRGLFGRGDLKVVVNAICLSPLGEFVQKRWSKEASGPLIAKRAVEELELDKDVFYYVGLFSTVGWTEAAIDQIPGQRNLLCCLIENKGGTAWKVHFVPDERWGGVERVYDPETDEEKVDRAHDYMREYLRPKGEFLILRDLEDDLDVPSNLVQTAIEELLSKDDELSIVTSGGRQIIKRSRL